MIKESIKRKLMYGVAAASVSLMLLCSSSIVSQACETTVPERPEAKTMEEGIAPHSAIIDWRYKIENGKLYRRQYNYTEQCWIGEWELCP